MRWLTLCLVLLAADAMGAPRPGKKPSPPPAVPPVVEVSHVEQARQLMAAFDFEGALTALEFAAAVKPAVAELIEILSLRAQAWAALENADKSAQAFSELLALKGDFALGSNASPKLRDFFAKGRALYESRQAVALVADAPMLSETGTTNFDVRVTTGARRVAELTFHFRLTDGPEAWQQMPFVRASDSVFSVKLAPLKQGEARKTQLAWYVIARDVAGGPVGTLGSAQQPQLLETQTQAVEVASTPFYKSWVFWTGVGVGVAAAVATPIVVDRATSPVIPNGSLGQVKLK